MSSAKSMNELRGRSVTNRGMTALAVRGGGIVLMGALVVGLGVPSGAHDGKPVVSRAPAALSAGATVTGATRGLCGPIDLTQNADPFAIIPGNSVSCYDSGPQCTFENAYARSFNLGAPPTGGQAHYVRCVEYGVDQAGAFGGGFIPVNVVLYLDTNGGPPNNANLVPLASITDNIPDGEIATLRTVDFTPMNVVVPPNAFLVVSVESPDYCPNFSHFYFNGTNNFGQTARSFWRAPACGVPDYVDLASIGFPGIHMVMTVELEPAAPPEPCCLPSSSCQLLPAGQCGMSGGTVVDHCPLDGRCVPPDDDCFSTQCGRTLFDFCNDPIPADFFAPGSEPFTGIIILGGPMDGLPDTVVRRFDAMLLDGPPETIPIELVALNLVSCQPITVNPGPTTWDVSVTLSLGGTVQPGAMTVTKRHPNGGTFDAMFHVLPRFVFTEQGNPGNQVILDFGVDGRPPTLFETTDTPKWVHTPSVGPDLHPFCGTYFVPGIEENPMTLEQCCTETCHAGPGHDHCTKQCSPCPRGACCNPADNTCSIAMSPGMCTAQHNGNGQYKGDGTNCDDSDGDGLADWFELSACCQPSVACSIASSPHDADSDDDGISDGAEVAGGTDPCVPTDCGNGTVDAGEECDGGLCCTQFCAYVVIDTTCRPSTGPCDPSSETCTGASGDCPADVTITMCIDGDHCCPPGCTPANDSDCVAVSCGPCLLYADMVNQATPPPFGPGANCIVENAEVTKVLAGYGAGAGACIDADLVDTELIFLAACPISCNVDSDCPANEEANPSVCTTINSGQPTEAKQCCGVVESADLIAVLDAYGYSFQCPHKCVPGACLLNCDGDPAFECCKDRDWFPNGMSESDCAAQGGIWQGPGTMCSDPGINVPYCPPFGPPCTGP